MEKPHNIFEILMDAICCVMCADKKVTTKERKAIHKILEKTKAPWDSDEINNRINRFIIRVKKEGLSRLVQETCIKLPEFKRVGKEQVLLKCIDFMAGADGVIDENEKKLCKKFRSAIQKNTAPGSVETILAPKAREAGSDIAATIAAPVEKDAAEIQREEQDVPVEWEEEQTILDLYEVKHVHRTGGMGLIYRVHHKHWDIDLAVKSPRIDFFKTEAQKENFIKECETWINLGLHPNIVSCYYVRMLGGVPRVFAEYVEGGSLKDWIDNRKLYEGGKEKALERILDISIQFAWGLHYAHEHEQKLIHQDVKPANLMMTGDGTAKVTDFGLAKARSVVGEATLSNAQQSILVSSGGMTPAYCSPEQANKQSLSRKTDIWSWGLSVLEMFAGEVFWRAGQAASEALESYLEMEIDDESIPMMPDGLIELLKQCFQRNPDDRPKDMQEIAERFEEVYKDRVGEEYGRPEPKAAELLADGLNNKALSMLDLGRREEAEKLYDKALEIDPHHTEATYNRGLLLWRSGRMTDDELVRQLEEVRTTHQDEWRDEYLLGLVHIERGDSKSAERVLKEAIKQAPEENKIQSVLRVAEKNHSSRMVRASRTRANSYSRVFFSSCGRFCFSNIGPTIYQWELAAGKCSRTISLEGHTKSVNSFCVSADNRWILTASADKTLRLWEFKSGKCLRIFRGHTQSVRSVCISPDGHLAISGPETDLCVSDSTALHLWDLATGRCLRIFEGHRGFIASVCFSLDGKLALSGGLFGEVRLWDLKTGKCLRVMKNPVECVCLSLDGRYGLSAGDNKTISLWQLSTGDCVRTFIGHKAEVTSVCVSDDGQWILSGSKDTTVRLWDLNTGKCLRTFNGHTDAVVSVAISRDRRWALSMSEDQTLCLWELAPIKHVGCVIALPQKTSEVSEKALVVGEAIRRVKSALEKGLHIEALQEIKQARAIKGFERNKKLIELSRNVGLFCKRKGLNGSWHVRRLEGHADSVHSVNISTDCGTGFSGSNDKTIRLWELMTGRCLRIITGQQMEGIQSISISVDKKWGLLGNRNGRLYLWDMATDVCLRALEGHPKEVNSVCISEDGQLGLSGSSDGTVRLWKLTTGACLRTFQGHVASVTSVDFSPDCCLGLSGSLDNTLRLWCLASGECLRSYEGHTDSVNVVCFSPNCQQVLSGSRDTTLRLWDLSTGNCLQVFEGHEEQVNCVCISPDGRWGITGSHDRTVRLWDLVNGRCEYIFEESPSPVSCVALSIDARWILFGNIDNQLLLRELDWNYEYPKLNEWDEGVVPYLSIFLSTHCSFGNDGVSRVGKPEWNEKDFSKLLKDLQYHGYGWLKPEGIRKKLGDIAANWRDLRHRPKYDEIEKQEDNKRQHKSIDIETEKVDEAVEILFGQAVKAISSKPENQIRNEYKVVSKSWGSLQLFEGPEDKIRHLVFQNLKTLASLPSFEGFRVEWTKNAMWANMNWAQVYSFYPRSFIAIRIWRSKEKLYVCGNYLFGESQEVPDIKRVGKPKERTSEILTCPKCGADKYKSFRLADKTVHKCIKCGFKDY